MVPLIYINNYKTFLIPFLKLHWIDPEITFYNAFSTIYKLAVKERIKNTLIILTLY